MASQDMKDFLFKQTGVAQAQWKRVSKSKTPEGSEVRIFEDKSSGNQIHTIETTDGTMRILQPHEVKELSTTNPPNANTNATDKKKAKKLITCYFEEGKVPLTTQAGWAYIPQWFNFSFYGNEDHDMNEVAKLGNAKSSVAGFTVFFSLKNDENGMCEHLQGLLSDFLPICMKEIQEASFVIYPEVMHIYDKEREQGLKDGTVPTVPYDAFVALLESKGFTYDKSLCPLACLGGSQGANAFVEPEPEKKTHQFCLIKVHNPNFDPNDKILIARHPDSQFITALTLDTTSLNREKAEKLISNTLKKYSVCMPGRLINGMLPHMELFQLTNRKNGSADLSETQRQEIYEMLLQAGWVENTTLMDTEHQQAWTYEDWAIKPFPKSHFGAVVISQSKVSEHEKNITFEIHSSNKKGHKPK